MRCLPTLATILPKAFAHSYLLKVRLRLGSPPAINDPAIRKQQEIVEEGKASGRGLMNSTNNSPTPLHHKTLDAGDYFKGD